MFKKTVKRFGWTQRYLHTYDVAHEWILSKGGCLQIKRKNQSTVNKSNLKTPDSPETKTGPSLLTSVNYIIYVFIN